MKHAAHFIAWLIMAFVPPAQAMELRWHTDAIEKLEYKSAAEIDITDKLGPLDPMGWAQNPAELDTVIQQLKSMPLPEAYLHYRTRLKKIDNGRAIRVRMVGVPVKFQGRPANDVELELRHRVEALTNAIMLQGDMDVSGNSANLTFYRPPKERNILTQFFYLPTGNIAVGDSWKLPVKFIELGPGIFIQHSSSHNQVTLTALKKTPRGTVAELQYLISEKVDGYVERLSNSDKGRPSFSMNIASVGYAEFLVEQGHWLRQVFVLSYAGVGEAKLHKQHLFALEIND